MGASVALIRWDPNPDPAIEVSARRRATPHNSTRASTRAGARAFQVEAFIGDRPAEPSGAARPLRQSAWLRRDSVTPTSRCRRMKCVRAVHHTHRGRAQCLRDADRARRRPIDLLFRCLRDDLRDTGGRAACWSVGTCGSERESGPALPRELERHGCSSNAPPSQETPPGRGAACRSPVFGERS